MEVSQSVCSVLSGSKCFQKKNKVYHISLYHISYFIYHSFFSFHMLCPSMWKTFRVQRSDRWKSIDVQTTKGRMGFTGDSPSIRLSSRTQTWFSFPSFDQWEIFRIQYMEVRFTYHMFGHMNCGDIPWNLGMKNRPYIWNRYLQSIGSLDGQWFDRLWMGKQHKTSIGREFMVWFATFDLGDFPAIELFFFLHFVDPLYFGWGSFDIYIIFRIWCRHPDLYFGLTPVSPFEFLTPHPKKKGPPFGILTSTEGDFRQAWWVPGTDLGVPSWKMWVRQWEGWHPIYGT